VHKTANVLDALPQRAHPLAKRTTPSGPRRAGTPTGRSMSLRRSSSRSGRRPPPSSQSTTSSCWRTTTSPREHWRHLRTTNRIESAFATVKLRTQVTKGAGSNTAALAMAYKLLDGGLSSSTAGLGTRRAPVARTRSGGAGRPAPARGCRLLAAALIATAPRGRRSRPPDRPPRAARGRRGPGSRSGAASARGCFRCASGTSPGGTWQGRGARRRSGRTGRCQLHGDVVLLLLEPVGARHPAAGGVVLDNPQLGDHRHQRECRLADAVPLLLAGRVVGDGRRERTEACGQLAAIVEHHDGAQPLPHVMQVIGLRERRRPRLASAGRHPAGSM
jgi:hypothetical protein